VRGHSLRALVANDLALHGRGIAVTMVAGLALFLLTTRLKPSPAVTEVSLIFNVNLLTTLLWGEWLISREKTKGTFAWLRTLPVPDHVVVLAKFVTAAVVASLFWTISSLTFVSDFFLPSRIGLWVVLQSLIVTFGAAGVAARWRFGQKVGQTLPMLVVLVPLLLLVLAGEAAAPLRATAAAWWAHPAGQASVAAALAAVYGVVVRLTVWWVRASETHRLTE